ncbi:CPBP family intramembrane glutamic endopeptidase [Phreatobacter sp.]|uniref:CPBP family intramembrane glutamic endopeptidase n=1 Tax=Phreatobacter sp. TaxID=1966341 RepID=UPI0022C11F05|nr:CPBP family intramembrane glutamic endopeptidase [Phreatobacter sp.]MCZ8314561.1 CPBP family intramembrane metalloprotease [Phreatobacter sp.]
MSSSRRLPLAFAVFALWIIVTVYGARLIYGTGVSLLDLVRHGVALNILAAAGLTVLACLVFGWRDMAAGPPRPGSLRLLWFPLLYLALLFGLGIVSGLPPVATLAFLAVNTVLVGLSEELMFRGILFRSLLTRMPIWPAIVATSVLFGSVHILNGFGTGDWGSAAVQALAAGLSGLTLMAILLRTGSILVAMAYHAAWDLATFTVAASQATTAGQGATFSAIAAAVVPVLFVLPNALYGLYLMRHIGRDGEAA